MRAYTSAPGSADRKALELAFDNLVAGVAPVTEALADRALALPGFSRLLGAANTTAWHAATASLTLSLGVTASASLTPAAGLPAGAAAKPSPVTVRWHRDAIVPFFSGACRTEWYTALFDRVWTLTCKWSAGPAPPERRAQEFADLVDGKPPRARVTAAADDDGTAGRPGALLSSAQQYPPEHRAAQGDTEKREPSRARVGDLLRVDLVAAYVSRTVAALRRTLVLTWWSRPAPPSRLEVGCGIHVGTALALCGWRAAPGVQPPPPPPPVDTLARALLSEVTAHVLLAAFAPGAVRVVPTASLLDWGCRALRYVVDVFVGAAPTAATARQGHEQDAATEQALAAHAALLHAQNTRCKAATSNARRQHESGLPRTHGPVGVAPWSSADAASVPPAFLSASGLVPPRVDEAGLPQRDQSWALNLRAQVADALRAAVNNGARARAAAAAAEAAAAGGGAAPRVDGRATGGGQQPPPSPPPPPVSAAGAGAGGGGGRRHFGGTSSGGDGGVARSRHEAASGRQRAPFPQLQQLAPPAQQQQRQRKPQSPSPPPQQQQAPPPRPRVPVVVVGGSRRALRMLGDGARALALQTWQQKEQRAAVAGAQQRRPGPGFGGSDSEGSTPSPRPPLPPRHRRMKPLQGVPPPQQQQQQQQQPLPRTAGAVRKREDTPHATPSGRSRGSHHQRTPKRKKVVIPGAVGRHHKDDGMGVPASGMASQSPEGPSSSAASSAVMVDLAPRAAAGGRARQFGASASAAGSADSGSLPAWQRDAGGREDEDDGGGGGAGYDAGGGMGWHHGRGGASAGSGGDGSGAAALRGRPPGVGAAAAVAASRVGSSAVTVPLSDGGSDAGTDEEGWGGGGTQAPAAHLMTLAADSEEEVVEEEDHMVVVEGSAGSSASSSSGGDVSSLLGPGGPAAPPAAAVAAAPDGVQLPPPPPPAPLGWLRQLVDGLPQETVAAGDASFAAASTRDVAGNAVTLASLAQRSPAQPPLVLPPVTPALVGLDGLSRQSASVNHGLRRMLLRVAQRASLPPPPQERQPAAAAPAAAGGGGGGGGGADGRLPLGSNGGRGGDGGSGVVQPAGAPAAAAAPGAQLGDDASMALVPAPRSDATAGGGAGAGSGAEPSAAAPAGASERGGVLAHLR
jgi:hypothetical protein